MTKLVQQAAKWASTIRLPKSTFPPRPAPADLATYIRRCTDDLYSHQDAAPSKPPFVLHDGPPYANGDLHAGHALNKILKDIICRTKLAEGWRVKYVPGWDCHGLPIELKALEHYGWKGNEKEANNLGIRKAARKFASDAVQKQMAGFKSWGIMADWTNHWKTMDKDYELRQLAVFRAMVSGGLIYRKHKPVYWSPSSRTALAEAELEYKEDHVSTAALVKLPIAPTGDGHTREATSVVIWTTTPWTLPANQAIAFNKDLQYSRVRSPTHGLLLIANARISYAKSLLGEEVQVVDEHITVNELLRMRYQTPKFLDDGSTTRPFFNAGFVTSETGTGFVHCAPGHGMEDYEALQPLIQAGLIKVKAPVDGVGCFTEEAVPKNPCLLQGKNVFMDGNKSVLQELLSEGLLLVEHRYQHKYPYDWRTKQPIIIRATAQWFADISSIKQDTLHALKCVDFKPRTGKSRLESFVGNRNEWCVSRQRAWGVPIPAIYHKQTEEPVLSKESIDHIIQVVEKRGIDAWWSDAEDDSAWILPGLSAAEYRRGTDTMDVWFDSGTSWTHMISDAEGQTTPSANIYLEGTDQHRGWFQSSLLTSVAWQKSKDPDNPVTSPFRTLITHGFTLDGEGKKMSKSIGNVVSPDEIISGDLPENSSNPGASSKKGRPKLSLGPDALRLWVASSDWTKDVVLSATAIKTVHAALHKYRVTFKVLLGALQDFDLDSLVRYDDLGKVDKMALFHLHQVVGTVLPALHTLEFYQAVTAINRWLYTDFSSLYFEACKDILYCETVRGHRRRAVQTVLYHVLCQMQAMLGPLLPILIEETWEHTPLELRQNSEHPLRRRWEVVPSQWGSSKISQEELPIVMAVNAAVKSAQEKGRSEKQMGSSLESDVELYLERKSIAALESWLEINARDESPLQTFLVVSRLAVSPLGSTSTDPEAVGGDWLYEEHVILPNGQDIGRAVVKKPSQSKCGRCWKYTAPASEDDSRLCKMCKEVVEEAMSEAESDS